MAQEVGAELPTWARQVDEGIESLVPELEEILASLREL